MRVLVAFGWESCGLGVIIYTDGWIEIEFTVLFWQISLVFDPPVSA